MGFHTKFPPCCVIYAATSDDCEKVRGGTVKLVIVLHNLLCASPVDDCEKVRGGDSKICHCVT